MINDAFYHESAGQLARAHNFQRHFLWLNIKNGNEQSAAQRTLFLTIFSGVFFFMPRHNFILLALRGNLLDFRGIKRQFLQLTRDDFSSTCSCSSIWLLPFFFFNSRLRFFIFFTIFHADVGNFLWLIKRTV